MSQLLTLNGNDIIIGVTVVDGDGNKVTSSQTVKFAIKNRTNGKWWNTVTEDFDLLSEPALFEASQVESTGIYEYTLNDAFDSTNLAFTVHIEATGTIAQDFYENESVQIGLTPAESAQLDSVYDDVTDIKAKTDNLPTGVKKNTAWNDFTFPMIDSSTPNQYKTGLTVVAQRRIDGGDFEACANAVSEVEDGYYTIDLAASDLNGDFITLSFKAFGANETTFTFKTEE